VCSSVCLSVCYYPVLNQAQLRYRCYQSVVSGNQISCRSARRFPSNKSVVSNRYFTAISLSSVITVADSHRFAAHHNKHCWWTFWGLVKPRGSRSPLYGGWQIWVSRLKHTNIIAHCTRIRELATPMLPHVSWATAQTFCCQWYYWKFGIFSLDNTLF